MRGFATPEGSLKYSERFASELAASFYRQSQSLIFSSIGIGSYLGEADDQTDELYREALKCAVKSGINVIDSAINYRFQRSEKAFGQALQDLFQSNSFKREELIICTKGGFIPFEDTYPIDPQVYLDEAFIKPGIFKEEDLVQGCHVMTPSYLENQLEKSLLNLGLETIDIYYIHNPETQLAEVDRKEFMNRIRAVFQMLEKKVEEGKIRMYGTATWNGYRVAQENPEWLSLEDMILAAREVAGSGHHFKVVQLPVNLAMLEAWILQNQNFGPNRLSLLGLQEHYGMTVIGSGSLLQAKLTKALPTQIADHLKPFTKTSQQALHFARSVPGLTTSLVGMKRVDHVRENLEVGKLPPMSQSALLGMFTK